MAQPTLYALHAGGRAGVVSVDGDSAAARDTPEIHIGQNFSSDLGRSG